MCEVTILMPCLNEAETLAICIQKAKTFLAENKIDGEILISDNGSTDGSQEIAIREGARVISVSEKGYGSALIGGCNEAKGKYVIMGDADDSYDFLNLMPFIEKLREGYELVMGNRFQGGIEDGAMPWLHRYIGNPVLSFVGRLFFKSKIGDFHCGLRGYNRESMLRLELKTPGMEYASEMVVMSELNHLRIAEVPTTLKKDGRSRAPHLRSFRDGWRHLKFLLTYAPNWLLLYPGTALLAIGLLGFLFLFLGQISIFHSPFGVYSRLYFAFFLIMGFYALNLYFIVKLYAYNHQLGPKRPTTNWNDKIKEDHFIFGGMLLTILGVILTICILSSWEYLWYFDRASEIIIKLAILAITLMGIGLGAFFSGFVMGISKKK